MVGARGRHPSTFHLREESLAGFSCGALSIDELLVPETTTDFGPDGASLERVGRIRYTYQIQTRVLSIRFKNGV